MKAGTLIKFGNNEETVGSECIISSPQCQILECENWRALWLSCILVRFNCQSAASPSPALGFRSKYYLPMHNVNVINLLLVSISYLTVMKRNFSENYKWINLVLFPTWHQRHGGFHEFF